MQKVVTGEPMSTWLDKNGRRHVGIMVNLKRIHRIMQEGATSSDAKLLEAELRSAVSKQKTPRIPGDPRMTDIIGLYITHAANLRCPEKGIQHAQRIGLWLEKYRASQAREAAAHIVRDMLGHYAPATINRSLGTLKKALHIAWEANYTPINYGDNIKRLPENNARSTYLSVEEVNAIASNASTNVQAAIWIALFTGARRGEICKMRAEDIGQESILIHSGNTKTLRTRTVPIVAPLRLWLKFIPLPINEEGIKSGWRRAREAANRPDVHFHDLRHSIASILIASGEDLYTVGKILGHSSSRTTERYAHMQIERLSNAMNKAFK